ncbi:MAG: FAD-dependent oxidoreductase, partial [Marinoscillum sp.]
DRIIPCDLALLAAGFVYPQKAGMIEQLELELDNRGNIQTNNYATNQKAIFSAGDMRRGQSLVVWAISEGREAAKSVDEFLMGTSTLPSKSKSSYSLV